MTLDNNLLKKIDDFKKFLINLIPVPTDDTPLPDSGNGSIGTDFEYARSDHQHPKSTLYAESGHSHDGLADSTWTTLTVDSNFYNYVENNTALLPLQYRKIGKIVEVIGVVGLNDDLTVGQWKIATLPSGCRPSEEVSFLCGLYNNGNIWTCIVKPNGDITFNNLRDITSSVTVNVTYTDSSTDSIDLAKATTYIAGTKWTDALKVNAIFMV